MIRYLLIAALAFALPALAEKTPDESFTQGEVRKVDKNAKKITIKHEAIRNLDMPAMTMVFQVMDPAMLEQVQPGDRVKFEAGKIGSALVVQRIEKTQ